ncbi:hypothetical protein BLNAU_22525 [Blattamonas nauphoetae]|uniref:Uncharacterized protein n=1 Tax=Blattamonas nauphoetae TaxID=2049346 RepID=A0ABQ9WT91_9EUKA|nr:hypothetical protein BLNAU_22525 [Blattamonas nauphoetae]
MIVVPFCPLSDRTDDITSKFKHVTFESGSWMILSAAPELSFRMNGRSKSESRTVPEGSDTPDIDRTMRRRLIDDVWKVEKEIFANAKEWDGDEQRMASDGAEVSHSVSDDSLRTDSSPRWDWIVKKEGANKGNSEESRQQKNEAGTPRLTIPDSDFVIDDRGITNRIINCGSEMLDLE